MSLVNLGEISVKISVKYSGCTALALAELEVFASSQVAKHALNNEMDQWSTVHGKNKPEKKK